MIIKPEMFLPLVFHQNAPHLVNGIIKYRPIWKTSRLCTPSFTEEYTVMKKGDLMRAVLYITELFHTLGQGGEFIFMFGKLSVFVLTSCRK